MITKALRKRLNDRRVVASLSTGKDSVALDLYLTEMEIEHDRIFLDTKWEHPDVAEHRERGMKHPRWIDAMVRLISNYCVGEDRFFRWHDSGDLQGLWHFENIVAVVRRTPDVQHWLPTREYGIISEYLATGRTIPDNLVVRLSAHMIDAEPVLPPELAHLPTSTVSTVSMYNEGSGMKIVDGKGSLECQAVLARDNKCGACRACWTPAVHNVSYPQH